MEIDRLRHGSTSYMLDAGDPGDRVITESVNGTWAIT